MSSESQLFTAIVKSNPKASKVMFYLTSYGFPWWVYAISIARFRRLGYEVVVYDFNNKIITNDDPTILPLTTPKLVRDISHRQKQYKSKGIKIFHGIGNSLGAYLLFNYSIHYPLDGLVLNGGGSMADTIFYHKKGPWNIIATAYKNAGYNRIKLKKFWAHIDSPSLGKNTKAKKVLATYSLKDGVIPLYSSEEFVQGLNSSGNPVQTIVGRLPHIPSVFINSHRVKRQYNFLNNI